jgi:tetratricopeptide (TPR) repeat protein
MRPRILLFLFFFLFLSDLAWTQETAEEWFKKGNEAAEAGDYEKAIRCFERTISLDPMHLGSYRNMGCVYGMRGMWDEAIEPFKKAISINPDDAHIHHNLGFCWYKKGIFDEAIAEFEKSIALDSEFRDAYHNLAVVYGKKKMFDKAIPMLKEALRIGPNTPDVHFSLGKAYKELGKDILAADHYFKAGMMYLKEGYREGALTAYENILPCSKEIAQVFLKELYPGREASDITGRLPVEKDEERHIVLRRMNVRESPSMSSKIIGKIDKDVEFEIIKEAPNNNAVYAWYLIKTESGLTGWLCGIYEGNVKYKSASKRDFLSFPSSERVGRP